MAWVYILYSPMLDKFYIGHTELTPEERLRRHLTNHGGFTSKAKDWKIVYRCEYPTKSLAYAGERRIKKLKSRAAIERLIKKGA
jgi:putative endonuclease